MDEDSCRGDSNGPFDEQTVQERREELRREKVGRRLLAAHVSPARPSLPPLWGCAAVHGLPLAGQPLTR